MNWFKRIFDWNNESKKKEKQLDEQLKPIVDGLKELKLRGHDTVSNLAPLK